MTTFSRQAINMKSLQGIMNEAILAEQEDRAITSWHISKIGTCPTGMYLERMGVAPDKELNNRDLRVFYMGKQFELEVVNLVKKYAESHQLNVITQERIEDKELGVSGKIDLLIEDGDEKTLFEIKSKHSRSFHWMDKKGEGANRHHMYQLWLYLKLLSLPMGTIYYISRDDACHLEYPVYLNDPTIESEVMHELNILNEAWKTKTPPKCQYSAKDWQGKYCRWHDQCKNYT